MIHPGSTVDGIASTASTCNSCSGCSLTPHPVAVDAAAVIDAPADVGAVDVDVDGCGVEADVVVAALKKAASVVVAAVDCLHYFPRRRFRRHFDFRWPHCCCCCCHYCCFLPQKKSLASIHRRRQLTGWQLLQLLPRPPQLPLPSAMEERLNC